MQSIAKTGTTATKAATIAEGTSPVRQAIIDQLAAKGVNYQTMTTKQQQNAYVDVIVQLTAKPAAENGSVTANYSSTAEIQAASKAVIAAQAGVKAKVKTVTGQSATKSYGYVVNGFATKVKVEDIAAIQKIAGVKSVTVNRQFYSIESASSSNDMANVSTVWNNYKYKGEGTVVSVIDTGIDASHKTCA